MIIIGLGTGRSGTASLADLLNAQSDAVFFHEMNPSCVRHSGTPRPILNGIHEFQTILDGGLPSDLTVDLARGPSARTYDRLCRMTRVRLIGDVAHYYLSYVEAIAAASANVRFVCLERDCDDVIRSFAKKTEIGRWRSKRIADRLSSMITRSPYYRATNHWMEHDGTHWAVDPVWDKCFPKFPGPTREEAIGQYWTYYTQATRRLADQFPQIFRIVRTETLNDPDAQSSLLSFCGIEPSQQVAKDVHIHKSTSR